MHDRARSSVGGLSRQEKVPGCPAESRPGKPLPDVKRESFDSFSHLLTHCVKVKVAQSCPTLCNPMNYTVHGTLQARVLEWVAFSFSRGSSQPRD